MEFSGVVLNWTPKSYAQFNGVELSTEVHSKDTQKTVTPPSYLALQIHATIHCHYDGGCRHANGDLDNAATCRKAFSCTLADFPTRARLL